MSTWDEQVKDFLQMGNIIEGEMPKVGGGVGIESLKKKSGNKCLFGKENKLKRTTLNFYETGGLFSTGDNCSIDAYFGIGEGCSVIVGDRVVFNGHATIKLAEKTRITIGNDSMFADGLHMTTTDWHSIIDVESGERLNPSKDITIGDRVWVAEDVRILKGVTIGHDSIIGAGSVVTKNVPNNVIVAGNPARIIKTGITWKKELI